MEFPKDDLIDLAYGDAREGYTVMYRELTDTSRWSLVYELVFLYEDKYYRTHYSIGATENQDESPYEYDTCPIACTEVEPYEKVIIKYKDIK